MARALNATAEGQLTNAAICAKCGGTCCKQSAGIYWPEEIELTVAAIVARVTRGEWAVDWWGGDPSEGGDRDCIRWVRPAHKNARGKPIDPSWGGECIFLGKHGCRVQFERRPKQCRMLVPLPLQDREANGGCHYEDEYSGKEAAAFAWLPHQELMDKVVLTLEEDA